MNKIYKYLWFVILLTLLVGGRWGFANKQVAASNKEAPETFILSGVHPDVPRGYVIIEGDIQIPVAAYDELLRQRQQRGVTITPRGAFNNQPWPGGVVPYEFNANVSAANQATVRDAMAEWEAASNVQFNQCPSNNCTGDYIHIQSSIANNSAVGRQGGEQIINIVSWHNQAIIAHELGHALGFFHTQSRPDRDTFVTINYNNICKADDPSCGSGFCYDSSNERIDCDFAFDIRADANTYGPYDFDSVMHYRRNTFSSNGSDTITVKSPYHTEWQDQIGQRVRLSQGDLNAMGCRYPRANWRFVAAAGAQGNGACLSPYNSISSGVNNISVGGILWIDAGQYNDVGTFDKEMIWKAPNGPVTIGE